MNFTYETKRLILKVLTPDYATDVLKFYQFNSEIFQQYEPLIGDNFYSVEHQRNVLQYEYQQITRSSMLRFWIFLKDNPEQIIGTVSFHSIVLPVFSSCQVGYKMDKRYTNKGYCKEALAFSMNLIMRELHLHRFEAFVMPSNTSSIHLLESLGYKKEGLLRDKVMINQQWKDHYLYTFISPF